MANEREVKADNMAGQGSFLDKLKNRRKDYEADVSGEYMPDAGEIKPDRNAKRGYTKESF